MLIIRKSKKIQYIYTIGTGLLMLYYFIGPYDYTRKIFKENPTFTIILGIVFVILFFYFFVELIKRKSEIILTEDGIELRDKGFFDWQSFQYFQTVYNKWARNSYTELILYFDDQKKVKFDITDLEIDHSKLVEEILNYKKDAHLFYDGHVIK